MWPVSSYTFLPVTTFGLWFTDSAQNAARKLYLQYVMKVFTVVYAQCSHLSVDDRLLFHSNVSTQTLSRVLAHVKHTE